MSSRIGLSPLSAAFPDTNFPQLKQDAAFNHFLAFNADTDQTAQWSFIAPVGLTGPYTVDIFFRMASATSGNIIMQVAVEAVTPDADSLNTSTTSSFDTQNSATKAVPGSAGDLAMVTVTLTNADSIAVGDRVRVAINRDANNGSDTATGDLEFLDAAFKDAA